MRRFEHLYILLPCHSLEDFPTHHVGKDAANLLDFWTVLWHPRLIASASSPPKWHQAEETPSDLANSLVLVPQVSHTAIKPDLRLKCEQASAILIDEKLGRDDLAKLILDKLDSDSDTPEGQGAPASINAETVADFFALGYGYLQVQLMTQQLRYSSSLDEKRFSELLVDAAETAIAEKPRFDSISEKTTAKLQACFDLLLEERNRYYPVEANLLDYTLLAETTLGKSLCNQLKRDQKMNLLMTGQLAQTIAQKHPATYSAIHAAIDSGKLDLLGVNQTELPAPLVSKNTIVRDLTLGQEQIEEVFDQPPTIFARRTSGLFPALPEILEKMDIQFALHSSLDVGRNPVCTNSNMRWEAPSGEMVLALSQTPVDANRPETFLKLAITIGEAIDNEHCAFVLFAHWPNRYSASFDDLLRTHKYGPLLGNFTGFQDCFEAVYDPGYGETHSASEYRNAYLKQAVAAKQANPISRYIDYWRQSWRIASLENLLLMAACYRQSSDHQTIADEIETIALQIDQNLQCDQDFDIDEQLDSLQRRLLASINPVDEKSNSITVINTTNFPRTQKIKSAGNFPTSNSVDSIYLRVSQNDETTWIANCPPMGHATLSPEVSSKKKKPIIAVVDGYKMRNEYFRIAVDPQTGGMRSLNLYTRRANILTQRLAMRRFSGHSAIDPGAYSEMVVNDVSVVADTPLSGIATSTGSLIIANEKVGEFQQRISMARGSRLVHFEVELDELQELDSGDAWGNYFCNRFAWLEEAATLSRDVHNTRYQISEQKICAASFIEIAEPDYQITFLTGGIPFHQRIGRRQLDSLLVVPNESRRIFQFALSINNPYAHQSVVNWTSEPIVLQLPHLANQASSSLFHFSAKNIALVQTRPQFAESGKLNGVRFRLQETEGRRGDLKIRCPYKIERAFLLNLRQCPIQELKIQNNQVQTDFLGSQMLDIELRW